MIDRRDFLRGLTLSTWLHAQDADGPIFRAGVNLVVLTLTVTDRYARYINGLKPGDLRVLEDGVQRRLAIFSESGKPPLLIHDDGTTSLLTEDNASGQGGGPRLGLKQFEAIRGDQENSYTIAYRPDPSDRNNSFRKISIEIVSDPAKNWRVRHRAGYRRSD